MLITVLAENSHIRAVGFEGEEIRFHASVQTEPRQTSDYYILVLTQLFTLYGVSGERITGVVLASVVPQLTPTLIDALARIAAAATSCSACRAASRPASISARTSRSRWVRTA